MTEQSISPQVLEVGRAPLHSKRNEALVLWLIAVGLFVASSVVRFLLADYPKGIGVLPDEIRYLNLATSLFYDGELIERGGLASFQKILYPLTLFPALLFDDPQTRVRAITALGCIYASSAVFPALVLARRIFACKGPVIICLLLTLIVPEMCYSMTFLSESVYLPLALWLVACCLVALDGSNRQAPAWSAGAGVLCYLAYLCKEVALGFALAFLAIAIARAVRQPSVRRASMVSLACFVGGFTLPFILLKLTLFSGLLNSYNQADPSVLLNPYTLLFALYALVSDATHFAIAFMFFPLVFPLLTWPRLTTRERELCIFCLLSFAFILLAVVYTISIREDLGHVGIRPHVRYVAPLLLPLLFLFLKQVLRGDGAYVMRDPRAFAAAISSTVAMAVLSAFLLGVGDYAQGFDHTQFHSVRLLGEWLPSLPVDPTAEASASMADDPIYHGELLDINLGIWLAKAVFVLYLAFGLWALLSRHRVRAGLAVVAFIALVMLAHNCGSWQYNESVYRVEPQDVDQVCAIDEFVDALPEGEQVLIVYDDDTSHANNLMDVYIDNDRLNCAYILEREFRDILGQDGSQHRLLVESDATMGDNIYGANGRTCDENAGISYLVANGRQRIVLDESCATDVTPAGIEDYVIYRIAPGAVLTVS